VSTRRIIAISPDESFGKQLQTALNAAGGSVELYQNAHTISPGDASLCVVCVTNEVTLADTAPRLPPDCPLIVVLPRPDVSAMVAAMQESPRVISVLVADGFDPRQIFLIASRVFAGNPFGLEGVMKSGTAITTLQVRDFEERARCLSGLTSFLTAAAVPARLHPIIEQCLDELLMNALYDAPVDTDGNQVFAGVTVRKRAQLRIPQSVEVQLACDDKHVAVYVRDAFGSLERDRVVAVLHKGIHGQQKVDTKAGGAGLGLYLMASESTNLTFSVIPGLTTAVLCTFSLEAARQRLTHLGFLVARSDVTGTFVSGRRTRSELRPVAVGGAIPWRWPVIAGGMAIAGLVAFVLTRSPAPPTPPTVEIESVPSGAMVEVDQRLMGETPLRLASLPAGSNVELTFRLDGYQPASAQLAVPDAGERASHREQLVEAPDAVRVRLSSTPAGARITDLDAAKTLSRTYTPAELVIKAGTPHRFLLTMPNHVPVMLEPIVAERGARLLERTATLAPGVTLRIEAPPGKVTVSNAPHCTNVAAPVQCTVGPGTYSIEHVGTIKQTRAVEVVDQDVRVRFDGNP
jgi:hypothetical protein